MKDTFSSRRITITAIFIVVGIIYIIRLAHLQIIDDSYTRLANRNALRHITQYPSRGLIYDRNGKLLVYNEAVYDLMVIPRQVKDIDTTEFCSLLKISKDEFIKKMEKAKKYSSYSPSTFEKQISKEDFAPLQEKLYKFEGFYAQSRTLRFYPDSVACHILGYIGEVNEKIIEENPYYKKGDYIGMSGLEKSYEEILRGEKGSKITLVDVHNREKGSFQNGMYDTLAIAGQNLYSTIDIELQKYAEKIMANKRGCIVAIEPSTGEILCFVSAPYYNPNLLVGRVRGKNYKTLSEDISKPLFNRVLMAEYPPGSIFKIAQSLIALDMGVITPNTGFGCDKGLVGCHNHPSASSVRDAIKMSCNPYFYRVFQRVVQQTNPKTGKIDSKYGLTIWNQAAKRMGFGTRLDIDLPNARKGYIPDTTFYNKWYPSGWNFYTIYSNSIGQGEVGVIPLQMANFAALVANRGWFISPHIVRNFGDESKKTKYVKYSEKHHSMIAPEYWDIAVEGMYGVVHEAGGTARRAKIDDIAVCGKTGTAENIGDDHSVFICFAPKNNPQIAVAVYIENAQGGGGTWAAPIASLIVEKHIRGKVEREEMEKYYIETNPCQPLPLKRKIKTKKK
ncbi:MAG: penicillin-binding protein 2 [Bacteroidales bacterium]|nr:penicillin-binding protein 2 [Bacteroidales bacterium]MEE1142443.1 penicillin-binding protein 2 [Bacteroidales bacterium]